MQIISEFDFTLQIYMKKMEKCKSNKKEIICTLQSETEFLQSLFDQLCYECSSFVEKRRELLDFLRRILSFSKRTSRLSREELVLTLRTCGLVGALEMALNADDLVLVLGALDIIEYLVEHWAYMLQDYVVLQINYVNKSSGHLINTLIGLFHKESAFGRLNQLSYIMSRLLCKAPDNLLNHFYEQNIDLLVKPFSDELFWNVELDQAQLLAVILELLITCVSEHGEYMTRWLLQSDLIRQIGALFGSRHKFLVLAAIRLARHLIAQNDPSLNELLISANVFSPLIYTFLHTNRGRDNLFDSAVIDLFECINSKHNESLAIYTLEHFWFGQLDRIDYVPTFRAMMDWCSTKLCRNEEFNVSFPSFDIPNFEPITEIDEDYDCDWIRRDLEKLFDSS